MTRKLLASLQTSRVNIVSLNRERSTMAALAPPLVKLPQLSFNEHTSITDALIRALYALDTNDATLFKSAWSTADSAIPVTFSRHPAIMTGYAKIHDELFNTVGPMDTTHSLSNVRITHVSDDRKEAKFSATCLVQHHLPGEGLGFDIDGRKNLLGGCLYDITVVKDTLAGDEGENEWMDVWRMKKWDMKVVWAQGDPTAFS